MFDFSRSLQGKLCTEPIVLSCGGGLCSKFRMEMMWPLPYKLLPRALPSTENAAIAMFVTVRALAGVSP